MNRRTPGTAPLAVIVLLVFALLVPAASGAAKKSLPDTLPLIGPQIVTVYGGGAPPATDRGYPVPIPGPIDPVLPPLHDTMRHLWMDHVVWSRNVTMSVFSDLKGKGAYEQRLVTNVYDLQNLLMPYFGEENAAYFGSLNLQHVILTSRVFEAYKEGNETAIRAVTYEWYLNAEEIAHFLCKVNANYDENEMQSLWKTHLDTVLDEMFDYKNGDYEGDVMCYDAAQDHADLLADYLSDNISTKGVNKK